jgi:hypothetical protein
MVLKENDSELQNVNNESNNEELLIISIKEGLIYLKKMDLFF